MERPALTRPPERARLHVQDAADRVRFFPGKQIEEQRFRPSLRGFHERPQPFPQQFFQAAALLKPAVVQCPFRKRA